MNLRTPFIAGLVAAVLPAAAWAQAPCAIPFQSYLVDEDGTPSDTPIDVEVTFYDGADAGAAPIDCRVFTSAAVNNGWLNLSIDACSLPEPGPSGCGVMTVTEILEAGAAEGAQVYMALRLGDDLADAGPRTPLGAVPYAVYATNAQTAVTANSAATADLAAELDGFDPDAVDAASVGGVSADALSTDAELAAHAADADAHHSALSVGLDITPNSVTTGSARLTDGSLDLGPDATDELTAAMVTTLTAGGNADALHTHAGSGGGGGACYTAYGTTACGDGATRMYEGIVLESTATMEMNNSSWAYGYSALGLHSYCVATTAIAGYDPSVLSQVDQRRLFTVTSLTNEGANLVDSRLTCAICCR